MPKLYVIRHGLAGQRGDYADDSKRPLTEAGWEKTRKVAKRLRALGVRIDLMLTSPYLRASQTAKIMLEEQVGDRLQEYPPLEPNGDIAPWLDWWQEWVAENPDKTLAIVGHEPSLSEWTEQLVWGKVAGRLILKKAGVIGLELPASGSPIGTSELFWLTPPRLLLN
jgi:phosphohistidine phosphatase